MNGRESESEIERALERGEPFANRYRIEHLLGTDPLGAVYLAEDMWEHGKLCIRAIRPELVADPERARHFLKKATSVRRLSHPNIVTVFDVSQFRDTCFVVMEHLPGRTLREWLRDWILAERDPSLEIAAAITIEILRALDEGHRQGVVHGALEPEKVMLLDELAHGVVRLKLLDYGIAPALAPEREDEPGPEADLYAAAAIFYEVLLEVPLSGSWDLPSEIRGDLGTDVDAICLKALDPDPRKRHGSAGELARALADLAESGRRSRGRPDLAALLAPERPSRVPLRRTAAPPPPPPPAPRFDIDVEQAFQTLLSLPEWQRHAEGRNESGLERALHVPSGLEFVLLPGGQFLMGTGEMGTCEEPIHWVSVPPFLICSTPCDREAWVSVVGRVHAGGNDPTDPATRVTFEEAVDWCERAGGGLRLPSEAEWEYACRAGTRTAWSFGDEEELLRDHAWFLWNSEGRPRRVGSLLPNPWGLYDMHGNVWEWCEDLWHETYEGAPTDGSAWVADGDTSMHVFRGGSWVSDHNTCRSAYRGWAGPDFEGRSLGFRPAVSLP